MFGRGTHAARPRERVRAVVSIGPLAQGTSVAVLIWTTKGPFKDYEVGVTFIVLLIIPCIFLVVGRRGVCTVFVAKSLQSFGAFVGGGKNQDVPGVGKEGCGATPPRLRLV